MKERSVRTGLRSKSKEPDDPFRVERQNISLSTETAAKLASVQLAITISNEPPFDPTVPLSPEESARLKNSRWLPPLADGAVPSTPGSKSGDGGGRNRPRGVQHTNLPNIPLSKGRFPMKEILKCHAIKKYLKNNENRRFLVEIKEAALKARRRREKEEGQIRKAQESSDEIAWDILRPLSRDPRFGQYIAALNAMGNELYPNHSFLQHGKSSAPNSRGTNSSDDSFSNSDASRSPRKSTPKEHTSMLPSLAQPHGPGTSSTGSKSTIGLRRPNHRSKDDRSRKADGQRVGMVVESKMLKSSKSFMDVRRTIEESAFGAVRMLERVENRRGLEDGYAFGRPSDLKEGRVEEYNRTFKDIAHVGHQVTDTLKASEKDKRNFSAYRTQRTVTTTSGPEKVKADSIPANSTRKQERTNPSLAHREDFLRAQAEATRNLSATISQRYKDRLETCADDERVRVLFKIVELDRRNGYILSTSADKKSVLSVLPHIWVGDANERLKALEPGYKRRPVFTRKALAATATSAERDRNAIASLLQAHGSTAAAAGHTRPKSVYLSSLRMEEYQRLVDGKDIGCVGGESPTVDDETVQVVAQVLDDYGEQFGVASREGEVRLPPGVGVECR